MKTNEWLTIIGVVIVVAIVASIITAGISGNVINVSPVTNGTAIYTQAEVDAKINALNSQVSILTARLNVCCPVSNQTNQTGSLSVTSSPSGAKLYVDGNYQGLTPYTASGLSVGNHPVQITKVGYITFSTSVNIQPGSNTLSANLTQQ